ncbi:MAG: Na+/glucose cotransporter, partial [Phaeodactylibacter sp.]|nr:Na+/glucose cotransporter [Phaeodactylibacter sp.]
MNFSLGFLDTTIIVGYFAVVFLLAWWVTRQERKAKANSYGSSDYFLGGKTVGWFVIGASLFASNIGSEHLVGLAGSGARGDMAAGQFEILAALILVLLGWVFVPFYIKSGVFTMPEFLEKRYSSGARTYLSIVSILAYILTKISVTIFAGALVFEVLGVPFWVGAVLVVLATGVYTIFGGLRAVIYTDMLQMFILLLGSLSITFFALQA